MKKYLSPFDFHSLCMHLQNPFRTAIAASTAYRRFSLVPGAIYSLLLRVSFLCCYTYAYIREFYEVSNMLLPSFAISPHISFSDLGCLRIPRSYSIAIN